MGHAGANLDLVELIVALPHVQLTAATMDGATTALVFATLDSRGTNARSNVSKFKFQSIV